MCSSKCVELGESLFLWQLVIICSVFEQYINILKGRNMKFTTKGDGVWRTTRAPILPSLKFKMSCLTGIIGSRASSN